LPPGSRQLATGRPTPGTSWRLYTFPDHGNTGLRLYYSVDEATGDTDHDHVWKDRGGFGGPYDGRPITAAGGTFTSAMDIWIGGAQARTSMVVGHYSDGTDVDAVGLWTDSRFPDERFYVIVTSTSKDLASVEAFDSAGGSAAKASTPTIKRD
jgi:hypothetical protein